MAAIKTLNAKNLAALGADRLAELLLELATGDAAAKRRLRLELASHSGGGEVASEIRKRLLSISRSHTRIPWHKVKALGNDLALQHQAILAHVAPVEPGEAFGLLWQMLDMAPAIYDRCGEEQPIITALMASIRSALAVVAPAAAIAPEVLAERVFTAVNANRYGQFDGLIALLAEPLGVQGLKWLKTKFDDQAAAPSPRPNQYGRQVIARGDNGAALFADNFDHHTRASATLAARMAIADALGDVDSFAACFSAEQQRQPAIAAQIGQRLLAQRRAGEAMAALALAQDHPATPRDTAQWRHIWIDALDAVGRTDDAQTERWALFERDLNAAALRAYIKRLPDFEDDQAEQQALAYVGQLADFNKALAFAIAWPAQDVAAKLVLSRQGEIDGYHYEMLSHAAEALEQRYPLAATLLLRAMIDFALINSRVKRYPYASRHLQTCAHLAKRIDDFGDRRDHAAYLSHLRLTHGRNSSFWNA